MIPSTAWERRLDAALPNASIHNYSTPPMLEALSLLPLAYRVGQHISNEKKKGRESVFDLNGVTLHPPHPGPFAGCPLGGMGSGGIGRGFRGDFRRWSLFPAKFIHNVVEADQFSIRVERGGVVHSKVLSILDYGKKSLLSSWNWSVEASKVTSYAVFPRAWLVFDEPVPGIRVSIRQISPFIPHSYSESSFPVCVFQVEVENLWLMEASVSVMFTFQNGGGECQQGGDGNYHEAFHHYRESDVSVSGAEAGADDADAVGEFIAGVSMSYSHTIQVSTDTVASNGGSHNNNNNNKETITDIGSFAIASSTGNLLFRHESYESSHISPHDNLGKITVDGEISYCPKFVVEVDSSNGSAVNNSAKNLWDAFHSTGTISPDVSDDSPFYSTEGTVCASAVCLKKTVLGGVNEVKSFPFSLAWDIPEASFGAGRSVSRYYTRFFGKDGDNAAALAVFALRKAINWEKRICIWQEEVEAELRGELTGVNADDSGWKTVAEDNLSSLRDGTASPTTSSPRSCSVAVPDFYSSLLFNELYFLVEGGSIWCDSSSGISNSPTRATRSRSTDNDGNEDHGEDISRQSLIANSVSSNRLKSIEIQCHDHDILANSSNGDQRIVGQYLYLEGHEYLMYNTYDVHFYSSFSILQLFPQLELSIQRDFAACVEMEDLTQRCMLADGESHPRKTKGVVPHDLGSPYEDPWGKTNAYNLQNVSNWKDLGPKFVLQVYRDYIYTKNKHNIDSIGFLRELYPVLKEVMLQMKRFDTHQDGMIQNSGFPDQTYDIWTAKGVHAYCGGLWIASCEAISAVALLMDDAALSDEFNAKAESAKQVYLEALWNGTYLNYDNSKSSHSDSIMADMMAGQWYASVCQLAPVVPRDVSLSCFRTIYEYNVRKFGNGKYIGAVNGMRPNGTVDNSCMQSREVWTGTTYGLAAAMNQEAAYYKQARIRLIYSAKKEMENNNNNNSSSNCASDIIPDLSLEELLSREEELKRMAFGALRGIHDGGWKEFGYWFATPEAWERNGNYRSLGYMRPLAIWAMQYECN